MMREIRIRRPALRRLAVAALGAALAALASGASAQSSFSWNIVDRGAVSALDVLTEFSTNIVNTGTVTDTYTITLVADMSPNWLTTMCDAQLCYPPFISTLQYTVAAGNSLFLGINITPTLDAGRGTSTITVTSANAPSQSVTAAFTIVTSGADVLVVDADGGAAGETAVLDAVTASGRTTALWDRVTSGKLEPTELGGFAAVIWHAGDNAPGLDADDRASLQTYVAGGGHLLLAGADLAYHLCDPASAGYDPAAVAWYAAVLGTGYVADDSGTSMVNGAAGDPVGNGLSFDIGGGANARADVLAAGGGTACLIYAGGPTAAVRSEDAGGRTVCLGFGLNGIADLAARNALTDAALDWLNSGAAPVPVPVAAAEVRLSAAPNPFNPRTTLWLENGADRADGGVLDIFDVRGRLVRTLATGALQSGRTALGWDGRDGQGRSLPGGAYVARLSAPGIAPVTVKLTLAK